MNYIETKIRLQELLREIRTIERDCEIEISHTSAMYGEVVYWKGGHLYKMSCGEVRRLE